MISETLKNRIKEIIPEERLFWDEPMSRHTSFRIGGPAALLVQINTEDELTDVMTLLDTEGTEYLLAGNGSNLLVSDAGYPGMVLRLGGDFEAVEIDEDDEQLVHVGAARLMSGVSAFLTEKGLSGFEFASGIPGSLGGAVFMNAGAYGGEMKDIVTSVRVKMVSKPFSTYELRNEDMDFAYRSSRAQTGDMIILSASLRLRKDDPAAIAERVTELNAKRNSKQPVNLPSAGSTFKRPAGGYAAALIEEAGLKGYRVGGAEVSEKHAGFVVNIGDARCEDVLAVMRHVRKTVLEKSGIELEPEVRLINCSL